MPHFTKICQISIKRFCISSMVIWSIKFLQILNSGKKLSVSLLSITNCIYFLFYSYDSREMTDLRPDRPDLWSEPSAFGDRAHFRVSTRPAVLSVTGVQRFDAGTYTCRVDFRQSPTVYHHVKLDIIGKFIYSFILL